MSKHIKPALLSILPSFILAGCFSFLINILGGMEKIQNASSLPMWLGFVIFIFLFVSQNNGQNIFGRFLKYFAYECWLSPLCVLIYTVISVSQANTTLGTAGAAGAGIGGFAMVIIFAVVGGPLGAVLYLIGRAVSKNYAKMAPTFENVNNTAPLQRTRKSSLKSKFSEMLICVLAAVVLLIFLWHFSDKKSDNTHHTSSTSSEAQPQVKENKIPESQAALLFCRDVIQSDLLYPESSSFDLNKSTASPSNSRAGLWYVTVYLSTINEFHSRVNAKMICIVRKDENDHWIFIQATPVDNT